MAWVGEVLGVLEELRLRKARALFLLLLLDRGPHRSEKLADLFWPEVPGEKAALSLRQTVRQLRLGLEGRGGLSLDSHAGQIALATGAADPALIEALAARVAGQSWDAAAGADALTLLDLMDGLSGISNSFDSWLAIHRARLVGALRRVLDRLLTGEGPGSGSRHEAAEFALLLEPENEVAARYLMRMHWQEGRPTRAVEVYNTLYRHLDEEFDQEPEAATVSLLAAIKLGPDQPPGAAAIPLVQPKLVIALRQGACGPLSRANESLAAVLLADLRMRLARFREWQLVAEPGPGEAHALITLRPAEEDGNLRLFADLERFPRGEILWSEDIPAPGRDWERKARKLLANIANALAVVVATSAPRETSDDVYDRWLRSQVLLDRWSLESEAQAIGMLRQITREAPRFGAAHAELAGALNVRHVLLPGTAQTEDVRQSALHHAIEAVSIDPLDTRAHRVLAWCYCHKSEFELADFHFEQSLTLNRSNPLTVASCALGFAFSHDLGRAAALVAEVKENDAVMEPFHLVYLAASDYLLGNYAEAALECERGAGLMSTVGGWHTAALWKLGRAEEAAARLGAFVGDIAGQWQGREDPDAAAIINWFVSVFPLRQDVVRQDLATTLLATAQHAAGMVPAAPAMGQVLQVQGRV